MIFHLTDFDLGEAALDRGEYLNPSLERAGFIHAARKS
jgi:uncharacterized protein (DUF952 family)